MNYSFSKMFFRSGAPSRKSLKDEEAAPSAISTRKERTSVSVDKTFRRKSQIMFITLTALIIIAIIIGWTELFRMPKIIKASAPQHIFSEERARVHLNQIAQRPRPYGSDENERVANYIISYADSLHDMYGSDVVEVQTQNVTTDEYNDFEAFIDNPPLENSQLVNVAILVKGIDHDDLNDEANKGSAVMISCHYDSAPYGPAASDDGISCATMLEMASALSSSPTKLKRHVLFLFTDAKEVGLLGSTTFFEGDDAHPWSLLPSIAMNVDNSAICGKEMFEKSNSRYGADAYFKYAAHPKAFSFSEWYDANVEEGWNDAEVYEKHGLHTLRLGCWSNSWAHRSIDDDIEHVSKGALQHMGENVLGIVKGMVSETNFPGRMQQKEGNTDGRGNSGLFYFTIIGGYIFSLSSKTASIIFPNVALALMMTMPLILYVTKTGNQSRTIKASFKSRWVHFLFALLNFIIGFGACIVAFAACCLWKQPTGDQLTSKANGEETANLAWSGLGYLVSIMSFFALLCTSLFVYSWPRKRALGESLSESNGNGEEEETQPSSKDESEEDKPNDNEKDKGKEEEEEEEEDDDDDEDYDEEESAINVVPDVINAIELSLSQEVSMLGIYGAEDAPSPSSKEGAKDDTTGVMKDLKIEDVRHDVVKDSTNVDADVLHEQSEPSLVELGKDVYIGVFYFYTSFLFILSIAMKDGLIIVLGQSIFMWFGAVSEMLLSWCGVNEQWLILTRAFLSTVPALLFLSSSVYWVLSDFWYFPNETDLGKEFWFGSPAIDALCIGLVVPLFIPHLVMVPRRIYRIVGSVSVLGFIVAASTCIFVSISKPRFVF